MKTYEFYFKGIDCPNCAAKLATQMTNIEGIDSAKINFLTEKLTVETELNEEAVYSLLSAAAKAFSRDIKIER